ncbi:MAG TPA: autotransporter assembly complex family protein, partial [Burkholderiales bacterium]|nr:autotransporter assembly complex family protein [Burkholderiales bacterium]
MSLLAGALLSSSANAYRVEVDAPSPLRKMLEQFLDLARYKDRADLNEDQFNFMLDDAQQQVKELVATEGYFSPKTEVHVDRAAGGVTVRIAVDPGPRSTISTVNLEVSGAAPTGSPEQVSEVRRTWALPVGNPFRQEDWNEAKENALRVLRNRNFAAAKIVDSRATVDPAAQSAALDVQYDSGPGFTLGPLQISGTRRYPARIIQNINPLREGEPYDAGRLVELQRQIQATPYFSNAMVDIARDPEQPLNSPVNVRVTEFPTQLLRGSVGYTSDTGARLQGQYAHNNVFGSAWVFDSQATIEQRRQTASIGLSMPPDSSAFVNNVHTSYERTTLSGIDLRSRRFGLRRSRNTQNYDLAWTLEYYSDQLQQLEGAIPSPDIVVQPGTHQALVAGGAWTRRRLDNITFPRDGHILTIEAGAAIQGLVTDQTFIRLLAQGRKYIPVGQRDLVLLRAEAGAVITKGGNAEIPASLLFRAGGTNSIRGYSSRSIGNEANGSVYPTRLLATASAEYQHWFNQTWGGALFYDVGTATDRWADRTLFNGVGFGARYRSPVGTINADLGYGIQRHQIRPHFS